LTDTRGTLVPGAALVVLAVPAAVTWSALLSGFAIALVPLPAFAALALAGPRPGRSAACAVVLWLLAVPLLAGAPVDQLDPRAWTTLAARVFGGALQLAAPGGSPVGDERWPLAAGLLLAGGSWIAAAALARRHRGVAFAVGAAPWVAAVLLHPARVPVWQGAAVVMAGVLWRAWPRTPGRATIAVSVAVALASAITAQAVVPQHRWFDLPGSHGNSRARFQRLDTEPTFKGLTERRTGAPMLEIRAPKPALWRMQVLDVFDGHRWRVSRWVPALPEPAAQPERVDVRVRRLENDLVVSPGAIERVEAAGPDHAVAGAAWRLAREPREGDEYRVDARVVRATAGELRRARAPRDPRVAAYTRLGWGRLRPYRAPENVKIGPITIPLLPGLARAEPRGFPIDVAPFGQPLTARAAAALARSPYSGVAALARRLASGARTQWQVVARVMHYLRDEHRFRYTTDVRPPGPFPLSDFLLRTRAGYCQHFAGAAALLLRLAGVPARMVSGFATGLPHRGRFEVRDVDAHAWIEVYFEGYGWVPFNPTPSVAPAAVARALDLLPATRGGGPRDGSSVCVILGLLGLLALAGCRLRRRPQLADALTRLVGRPIPPSTTLGELGEELARTVGPHTAALAAEAERARFSPQGTARQRWTSTRIARALARDLGPRRAVLMLALPAVMRARGRECRTTGAASAGARASQKTPPVDLA
jgi:transglutaminase-like putative cysteine protease